MSFSTKYSQHSCLIVIIDVFMVTEGEVTTQTKPFFYKFLWTLIEDVFDVTFVH
jgi:hypothetical protein